METVQEGMQVVTLAGPVGVVSAVEGNHVTVQRENGQTMVLEAGDYALEGGVVHLRHGSAASSSRMDVTSAENATGAGSHQGDVQIAANAGDTPVINQLREETFEMRARIEELVITKVAHVVEEIVLRKDAEERTELVHDIVRRTEVDVQPFLDEGGVSAIDTGSHNSL